MERTLTLVGLGPGSPEALTLGALRALQAANQAGTPILLRTRRHPSVDWLSGEQKIVFDTSFDEIYDHAASFDQVYTQIAERIGAAIDQRGRVVYAVPGHPLIGERSVDLLLVEQEAKGTQIEVVASSSLVDAVLGAARIPAGEIKLVDALALADVTDAFRALPLPFDTSLTNIVYQVYDRQAASRAKLALLTLYPPDFPVSVVRAAGVAGQEQVAHLPLAELDHSANMFDHLTSILVPPNPDPIPSFDTLADIMAQLRNPDTGCPWDKEQTPETLRRYMIEEAYEVLEAIDEGDPVKYAEELGDLLLQVVFHAQLAKEADQFTVADVVQAISEKLLRRHPHVFGDAKAANADEVLKNWEKIKRAEPGYEKRKSILDGIPKGLPALLRAQEVSKRAARAGFEWESIDGVK